MALVPMVVMVMTSLRHKDTAPNIHKAGETVPKFFQCEPGLWLQLWYQ